MQQTQKRRLGLLVVPVAVAMALGLLGSFALAFGAGSGCTSEPEPMNCWTVDLGSGLNVAAQLAILAGLWRDRRRGLRSVPRAGAWLAGSFLAFGAAILVAGAWEWL